MSTVAPPVPAPAAAPASVPDAPRSWSWRVLALGLVLILVLAAIVGLVLAAFGGAFASYAVAQAQLPADSTAVALGAPVEYRNVTVGTVASQGQSVPGGLVRITVHLQPGMLHVIPAGVRATETPVSFFGDPYIVLVAPATVSGPTLRAGATIPALRVGQTASLQATLGDLDNLLTKLHPAELDAALTALASAVQGNGTSLGHNLVRANTYFGQMLPLWPTVVANLQTLVPVANQFAASTPDLLRILANQSVTASTVNHQAAQVRSALSGGNTLAGQAAQLLDAIEQPYAVLAADSGPFLQAISQNPDEISQLLSGLDDWATAWSTAESSGPYLQLTQSQVVVNPADLGLAVLGGPEAVGYLSAGLGPGYVNPPTYGGPGTISTGSAATTTASVSPPLAEPAQTAAVSRIVRALTGSAPRSPAAATLLLSPLLQGLVTTR